VDIDSEQGKGSVFTIRLPLTMAIMDGMIVQAGNERYLLPVLSIIESIRPEASDVFTVQGKGEMVKVRGQLIQIIRIHELFNLKPLYGHPSEALIIIVDIMGRVYGLMVDKLLGQQQVVIKSLKSSLCKVEGISGSAILGDGRVGLILDPKGLVSLEKKKNKETPARAPGKKLVNVET
jgi:two-component system chemotaxis sensor kinase CheA